MMEPTRHREHPARPMRPSCSLRKKDASTALRGSDNFGGVKDGPDENGQRSQRGHQDGGSKRVRGKVGDWGSARSLRGSAPSPTVTRRVSACLAEGPAGVRAGHVLRIIPAHHMPLRR